MCANEHRSIWHEHPDLVAIYESPRGELALLIDNLLLPPQAMRHRRRWLKQTRHAARRVTAELRRAGVHGDVRVLQFLSAPEVTEVLRRWSCRYDGDPRGSEALARQGPPLFATSPSAVGSATAT